MPMTKHKHERFAFQSLIGEIQTGKAIDRVSLLAEFQSLIGKIQTKRAKLSLKIAKEFQSLIGKIQTLLLIRTIF